MWVNISHYTASYLWVNISHYTAAYLWVNISHTNLWKVHCVMLKLGSYHYQEVKYTYFQKYANQNPISVQLDPETLNFVNLAGSILKVDILMSIILLPWNILVLRTPTLRHFAFTSRKYQEKINMTKQKVNNDKF